MSKHDRWVQVTKDLDEHQLWLDFGQPNLADVRPNVRGICQHGFTEMVNNVVDHSGSADLYVAIEREDGRLSLTVKDNGIGVFRKIREALGLANDHAAALELAKGKVTTDPERHSGGGIFFTARMFDHFMLLSGEIIFNIRAGETNWWHEDIGKTESGTFVQMEIAETSERTTAEVFNQFAPPPSDYQFDTTVLALKLFGEGGGRLVSRSQAKRILSRLGAFKVVVLDFEGVEEVGPAFADEVFRVFLRAHPEIRIIPVGANEATDRMILRALARNGEASNGG